MMKKVSVATINTLKMPIATRLMTYFAIVLCHSVSLWNTSLDDSGVFSLPERLPRTRLCVIGGQNSE